MKHKHPHHDLLVTWLADQTLNIEYRRDAGEIWSSPPIGNLSPITAPEYEWRIKPKMVRVGRHEWPMPLDVAPPVGATYFLSRFVADREPLPGTWANTMVDNLWLKQGFIHLTREAAQQHADALVCINRGDVE